ncbi:MAG: putative peptidoglycan-binding domain-containing protein [Acidobacteriota bacterium]
MGQLAAFTNVVYRRSDDLTSEPIVRRINNDLVDTRIRFYERIAHNDPTQIRFLNGWRDRANSFRR